MGCIRRLPEWTHSCTTRTPLHTDTIRPVLFSVLKQLHVGGTDGISCQQPSSTDDAAPSDTLGVAGGQEEEHVGRQ